MQDDILLSSSSSSRSPVEAREREFGGGLGFQRSEFAESLPILVSFNCTLRVPPTALRAHQVAIGSFQTNSRLPESLKGNPPGVLS